MSCKTVVVAFLCAASCTIWADGFTKAEATEQAKIAYKAKNYALALKLAEQGDMEDAKLLWYMGCMYYGGLSCPTNREHALKLFEVSAEKGLPVANMWLGCHVNIPNKEYGIAEKRLRAAAEKNYDWAYFYLGYMYQKGYIKSDDGVAEAVKCFKKAAFECDHSEGGGQLLCKCANELWGKDDAATVKCWRMAADLKESEALYYMGKAYHYAWWGLEQDVKRAEQLFLAAVSDGVKHKTDHRETCALKELMDIYAEQAATGNNSNSLKQKIQECCKRLVQFKCACKECKEACQEAYLFLGLWYCNELKDYVKGVEAYTSAANMGSGDAWTKLGVMYEQGEYVKKSLQKAKECYEKGASLKSVDSLNYLSHIAMQEGDDKNAEQLLRKAYEIEKDNAVTIISLIYLYKKQKRYDEIQRILASVDKDQLVQDAKESPSSFVIYHLADFLNSGLIGKIDENASRSLKDELAVYGDCCECAKKAIDYIKKGDIAKAEFFLKQARNPNCPNVLYVMGMGCINHFWKESKDGIGLLELAAKYGSDDACLWLAQLYATPTEELRKLGLGIETNAGKAKSYALKLKKSSNEAVKRQAELLLAWIPIGTFIVGDDNSGKYRREFSVVKSLAEQGMVQAFLLLSMCYRCGIGTSVDRQKADMWYEKACKKAYDAPSSLMPMYRMMTKSHVHVTKALDKESKRIKVLAQIFGLDRIKCEREKDSESTKLFTLAVEELVGNEKKSRASLQNVRNNLREIRRDSEWQKVVPLYLAMCDFHEQGKSCIVAVSKIQEYAERGNVIAMPYLIVAYGDGIGVKQNFDEARRWIDILENKCKELHDHDLDEYLNMMFPDGLENGIKRFKDMLNSFENNAAHKAKEATPKQEQMRAALEEKVKAKEYFAIWMLAEAYEHGRWGYKKDQRKADELYDEVKSNASDHDLFEIGNMYFKGASSLPPDMERAQYWYGLSAQKGNRRAKECLQKIQKKVLFD